MSLNCFFSVFLFAQVFRWVKKKFACKLWLFWCAWRRGFVGKVLGLQSYFLHGNYLGFRNDKLEKTFENFFRGEITIFIAAPRSHFLWPKIQWLNPFQQNPFGSQSSQPISWPISCANCFFCFRTKAISKYLHCWTLNHERDVTVVADYIELHIIIKILHFTGFLAVPSPFDFCAFMKHLRDTKREAEKTPLHSLGAGWVCETKAQENKT